MTGCPANALRARRLCWLSGVSCSVDRGVVILPGKAPLADSRTAFGGTKLSHVDGRECGGSVADGG